MTQKYLPLMLETPSAALVLVVVAQIIAWFVTTNMGIQQLLQLQILISIPAALLVLYALFGLLRGKLDKVEVAQETDSNRIVNSQLKHTWGPSLDALECLISLAEKRIQDAQRRLQYEKQGNPSSLFEMARTAYKSIQVTRGILVLCRNGYPDQAYILCRTLLEQRVNLGFILTSGKIEDVAQRYLDWQKAEFYRFIKRTKERRDKMVGRPTDKEWSDLTNEYQSLKAKYASGIGDIDKSEEWAIAYREGLTKTIRAFNVVDRARHSMPRLVSDKNLLFDVWEMEWQDLNEFTHTTPRSINESASSSGPNVVVSGPSSIGIYEPARIAGREVLNLSSMVSHNLANSSSPESEELNKQAMKLHRDILMKLDKIPAAARSWHQSSSMNNT